MAEKIVLYRIGSLETLTLTLTHPLTVLYRIGSLEKALKMKIVK